MPPYRGGREDTCQSGSVLGIGRRAARRVLRDEVALVAERAVRFSCWRRAARVGLTLRVRITAPECSARQDADVLSPGRERDTARPSMRASSPRANTESIRIGSDDRPFHALTRTGMERSPMLAYPRDGTHASSE